MDNQMDNNNDTIKRYLNRPITRRQAIKVGGLAALGLAFSKPIIDTIRPTPIFAHGYGGDGGGSDGCCVDDVYPRCEVLRWAKSKPRNIDGNGLDIVILASLKAPKPWSLCCPNNNLITQQLIIFPDPLPVVRPARQLS